MKTIDSTELANVTGGANLWQNIGSGVSDTSPRWANNTYNATQPAVGQIGGGFLAAGAGLLGGGWGILRGVGATLGIGSVPE